MTEAPSRGRAARARVLPPHTPASRSTCARRRAAPTCRAGAPADSVCPLGRDGGGGVGASRAGRGGAAPPVSPGTPGPWEPGTRRRREAEVGEGRRAHALASRPAVAGSPFARQGSYFQVGRKVPDPHPPSTRPACLLRAPSAAARAGLRTLRSASRAPLPAQTRRGNTRGSTRGLRDSRLTHTCCFRTPEAPKQPARTRTPAPSAELAR